MCFRRTYRDNTLGMLYCLVGRMMVLMFRKVCQIIINNFAAYLSKMRDEVPLTNSYKYSCNHIYQSLKLVVTTTDLSSGLLSSYVRVQLNYHPFFVTTLDIFITTESWRRRFIVFIFATLLRVRSQHMYLCPNKNRLNYMASLITLQGKECSTHFT
jgi:hypothetical protein